MKRNIVIATAIFACVVIASPASAQTPSAVVDVGQAELRLDQEMQRQHQRRIVAYEKLKDRLDFSINASAEARNLAVGSGLQMLTPITEIKVQQMQQQQLQQGYR
jgi:hypothetical protein